MGHLLVTYNTTKSESVFGPEALFDRKFLQGQGGGSRSTFNIQTWGWTCRSSWFESRTLTNLERSEMDGVKDALGTALVVVTRVVGAPDLE